MRSYHVLKRGNRYHYVCRVPGDLSHFFPVSIIYRSLKTSNHRVARLLAATLEHTTQGVFMKLRSGHLDENAIKQILTSYLGEKLVVLEARLMHRAVSTEDNPTAIDIRRLEIINEFAPLGEQIDRFSAGPDQLGINAAERTEQLRAEIKNGVYHNEEEAEQLAAKCGFKLHKDDQQLLQLRLLRMEMRLANAERAARQDFDLSVLEELKEHLIKEKAAIKPKFILGEAVADYLKPYNDPKSKLEINTNRAARREAAFILKTLGKNMELAKFNSKSATTQLTNALNTKQKSTGELLANSTKGAHLKRLSSIVSYVIDKNELDVLNKIKGTYASVGQTKKRNSYGPNDLKKLVDALCAVPMTYYGRLRNDRIWIILIAILQGFRKSAIVNLRERHITTDEHSGLPCFDLSLDTAPANKPRNSSPVHPMLINVGFLKWFDKMKTGKIQRKLFEDDPESFGQWYNGMRKDDGWNREHITKDKKKTFHSLKHYFCVWTEELRISKKERNEMSCHAVRHIDKDARSTFYLERTRVARMRANQDLSVVEGTLLMKDLDWLRLEARAKELFTLQ